MTKAELVSAMAAKTGMTKRTAERALNALMDAITESLRQGDRVALVGFGTFAVARRAERTGRNPRTGVAVKIPARRLPVFRAGKNLRDAI